MRLQRDFFRSNAMVVANRNSDPQGRHGPNTTSYIVTVYAKTAAAGARLRYPDRSITYFGGDIFLDDSSTAALADHQSAEQIVEQVRTLTGGSPLIVNLEGVLLDEPPEGIPVDLHYMRAALPCPFCRP